MSRFKTFVSTVCFLLLGLGCVSPEVAWAQTQAQVEAYSEQLIVLRDRGEITWLEWRRRVNSANRSLGGSHPIKEEFYAATEYIAAEVDARRVTPHEGTYLIAKARSDAQARLTGQVLQVLPYAIQQQQQQQQQQEEARRRALRPPFPTYTPPPTFNTNCTTDRYGYTSCTTTQQ